MKSNSEVALYAGSGLEISLPFDPELETLWASQAQIESIFGIDQSGVSRHLKKIFSDQEVDPKSNMQKMQIPYTPTTEEMICSYCGKKMIAAESMINNKYFCHTFSDEYPTW